MTVPSTLNRKTFSGDDASTSFGTSPVVFFESGDLDVYLVDDASGVETLLTESSDYTVSGGGTPAAVGTVNLVGGPLASGSTLVIVRNLEIVQEADFVNNDGSDADVAEAALDRLTMQDQQLDARIERSVHLSDGDTSGRSTELPAPDTGMLLGWGDEGLVNFSPEDIGTALPSAFVSTLLDDADADSFVQTLVADLTDEEVLAIDDVLLFGDTSASKGRTTTFQHFFRVIDSFGSVTDTSGSDSTIVLVGGDPYRVALQNLLPAPRTHLSGFELSNGTDAVNDLNVAEGQCADSTNLTTISLSAALTGKRLDATFSSGSGGGMLDTGSPSNTTYHIFAIKKDDGSGDILASTSASAPTMPANYTHFRCIGSIPRVGGSLVAFSQDGDEFLLNDALESFTPAGNPGASAVSRTLAGIPIGRKVRAIVNWTIGNSGTGVAPYGLVSSLDVADTAPALGNANVGANVQNGAGSANTVSVQVVTRTNTAGQVRSRLSVSDGSVVLYGATVGWIDRRGK